LAWATRSRYRKTGNSNRRSTDSALGTVTTRSRTSPGARFMGINLARNSRHAQRRHGVFRKRIVVNHVGPRRGRPGQLGQIEALLLGEDVRGLEGLLRGLDRIGGQRGERVDG